jgi:hypothetical protein
MNIWHWLRKALSRSHGCQFVTTDDWGYGNYWFCTTHQRWYPGQVFMEPPKCCREFEVLES